MLDEFLEIIDKKKAIIGVDVASREYVYFIFKNLDKHKTFKISLGYVDSKDGGADIKGHVSRKVGYLMYCKKNGWVGRIYGVCGMMWTKIWMEKMRKKRR